MEGRGIWDEETAGANVPSVNGDGVSRDGKLDGWRKSKVCEGIQRG